MSTRDEYVAKWQAKLDEWNADIDLLEAKARQVKAQMTQDHHERLAALKSKRDQAAEKLKEVQAASDAAWDNLKARSEEIWDGLKEALEETKQAYTTPPEKTC